MEDENYILFHITKDQQIKLINHFNKQNEILEEYEICELLDEVIDSLQENEVEDDLPF